MYPILGTTGAGNWSRSGRERASRRSRSGREIGLAGRETGLVFLVHVARSKTRLLPPAAPGRPTQQTGVISRPLLDLCASKWLRIGGFIPFCPGLSGVRGGTGGRLHQDEKSGREMRPAHPIRTAPRRHLQRERHPRGSDRRPVTPGCEGASQRRSAGRSSALLSFRVGRTPVVGRGRAVRSTSEARRR